MSDLKQETSRYHTIADGLASLLCDKQRAYGDSFSRAEKILKVLYPSGIPVHAFQDALAIVRILDKLSRIATDDDPFNEDPWMDIAGYALLSLGKRHALKEVVTEKEPTYDYSNTNRAVDPRDFSTPS